MYAVHLWKGFVIRDSKQEHLKFIICCYYYLLLFGDKREVYLLDESAQPVTEKESMGEGKRSIEWNMDSQTIC